LLWYPSLAPPCPHFSDGALQVRARGGGLCHRALPDGLRRPSVRLLFFLSLFLF
jgi:hypothetical protein